MDLSEILHPRAVAEFLAEDFGCTPLHLAGPSGRFAALLSWDAVKTLAPERLDEIHPPVALLARNLEHALEATVRARLDAGAGSEPLRRCDHDLLILQIAGQNSWRVYERAEAEPVGDALLPCNVKAGDTLYIPGGFWHAADASESKALRLTVSIENPSGNDLLNWIARGLKENEILRKPIPRFADPPVRADYITALRKTVAGVFRQPGILDHYLRYLNRTAPSRPVSGLPWTAAMPLETLIAIATPRRLRIRRNKDKDSDNATLRLVAGGQRLVFPEEAAPLLHYLSDRAPVSIAEFYGTFEPEFDRDELSDLLAVLSKNGIIALHQPGSLFV